MAGSLSVEGQGQLHDTDQILIKNKSTGTIWGETRQRPYICGFIEDKTARKLIAGLLSRHDVVDITQQLSTGKMISNLAFGSRFPLIIERDVPSRELLSQIR